MKKTFLAAVGLLLFSHAAAQTESIPQDRPSYTMTLEDCLMYAMGNSYSRQQMELSEESYAADYDQSKLERLPNLNASLSENFNHTKGNSATWGGSYGINTGMMLYQGGSISNTIEQGRLRMEQASYRTAQYDNRLTIQILQNFLTVLGNEDLLKYLDNVLETSKGQLQQGEERFKWGTILESDYMMLKAQVASDMNNIVDAGINRDNSLLALKGLLSMDMDAELRIAYPDTSAIAAMTVVPSLDYFVDRAMNTLPDLDILQYGVDIAATNLKISKAGYFPTLSLSGGIGTGHQRDYSDFGTQLSDRFSQQAGLSLSVPIFNRNRTRTNVTKSRIALMQAELDQKQSELDIRQTVIGEYLDMQAARSKFLTLQIKEEAYRRSFEVYGHLFEAGSITPVELLQQQNNYINVLNDFVQSKYNFILRRKMLDVYMGERIVM